MKWQISKRWLEATPQDTKRKRKPEPETGLRRENLRIFTMAYLLIAIVLAIDIVALYTHYSSQRTPEVPSEILGTWTTTAPGYDDRALEITVTSLIFHAGASERMKYSIDQVRAEPQERTTSYTVLYGGMQDQQTLAFEYATTPNVTIRLRNQQHRTWMKQSTN